VWDICKLVLCTTLCGTLDNALGKWLSGTPTNSPVIVHATLGRSLCRDTTYHLCLRGWGGGRLLDTHPQEVATSSDAQFAFIVNLTD
jgi:hypothetical protein